MPARYVLLYAIYDEFETKLVLLSADLNILVIKFGSNRGGFIISQKGYDHSKHIQNRIIWASSTMQNNFAGYSIGATINNVIRFASQK